MFKETKIIFFTRDYNLYTTTNDENLVNNLLTNFPFKINLVRAVGLDTILEIEEVVLKYDIEFKFVVSMSNEYSFEIDMHILWKSNEKPQEFERFYQNLHLFDPYILFIHIFKNNPLFDDEICLGEPFFEPICLN